MNDASRRIEQSALSCAMISAEAASFLAIQPDSLFCSWKNRAVHEAIKTIVKDTNGGVPADIGLITVQLQKSGLFREGQITLDDLLAILDLNCPPASVKAYAHQLQLFERQRRLNDLGTRLADRTEGDLLAEDDLSRLESELQETLFRVSSDCGLERGWRSIEDGLNHVLNCADGKMRGGGLKTGFAKLDWLTSGLRPQQLIVVSGRPGHGKTAFALDVALRASQRCPVAFFSLEMSFEELTERLCSKLTGIEAIRLHQGHISEEEHARVFKAVDQLAQMSLYILDHTSITPAQLRTRVLELITRHQTSLGLVVIDYLQLLKPERSKDPREQQVASISRDMKALAKDLNLPVLLLCQLNREVEKREDKRPRLSDLRESGAIEQDADLCVAVFQPWKYSGAAEDEQKAEAIVLKQRNGRVGTVDLRWIPETMSFEDQDLPLDYK